jgi:hypothetical protein
MPDISQLGFHLDDLEGGICRERSTLPDLSKARSAVQSEGGRAVNWSPQTESSQPVLPRPVENLVEKSTSDSTASPGWVYPHTANPSHLAVVPVTESVGRAQHILALIRNKHHLTFRRSNGTGKVLPVRGRPSCDVFERLAKGIRRVLQGSQSKFTVKPYLVRLQPSKMHKITPKAAEREVDRPVYFL